VTRSPAGNFFSALYHKLQTQSSAPEDGRNYRPKHVELIVITNKLLLLHLVGFLYYYCYFFSSQSTNSFWTAFIISIVRHNNVVSFPTHQHFHFRRNTKLFHSRKRKHIDLPGALETFYIQCPLYIFPTKTLYMVVQFNLVYIS